MAVLTSGKSSKAKLKLGKGRPGTSTGSVSGSGVQVAKLSTSSVKAKLKLQATKQGRTASKPVGTIRQNGVVSNTPSLSPVYSISERLLNEDASLKSGHIVVSQTVPPRKAEKGRYLAMDCEFVGVGPYKTKSILARVSIVNYFGVVVYDTFVKPSERVTDWRTWVSGVTPALVRGAPTFGEVQTAVSSLLKDTTLVGHGIHHDLQVLELSHPKSAIRDTTTYGPFRETAGGKTPSLKKLAEYFLDADIQGGQHSSVEDAQATMLLYRLHRTGIESFYRSRR